MSVSNVLDAFIDDNKEFAKCGFYRFSLSRFPFLSQNTFAIQRTLTWMAAC